jgi:hypothetical protein
MLSQTRFPKAKRAAELITLVFGSEDALAFLRGEYGAQHATMGTLLQRLKDDGLDKEIDGLLGPDFLTQIREAMPRYEAMVKGRLRRDDSFSQNLKEHVVAMQGAILAYATKVVATVEDDEPESAERAHTALRPIEAHREVTGRQRSSKSAEAAPSKPAEPIAPEAAPKPDKAPAANG